MNHITSQQQGAKTSTSVQTPLGKLNFYLTAIGGEAKKVIIAHCQIYPSLPEYISVDGCVIVLLQFSAMEKIEEVNFCCAWEDLKTEGYGCHGEGLEAYEWEQDEHLVIIGTEDPYYLNHRIPLIPAETYKAGDYPITMEENEIKICLKKLPADSSYSLHYVITWNKLPEPLETSCWLAVDRTHQSIRELLANPLVNDSIDRSAEIECSI
jgi:hypothetical protein